MALAQNQLRQYSSAGRAHASTGKAAGQRVAFLCHSHKDEALALGLQAVLRERGVYLYIDWQDAEMPDKPSAETATRLRNRIRQSNLFLFLATQNSMSSKWCPWELGYADGVKPNSDDIVVVPTTDAGYEHGAEYMNLYRRIDTNALGALQVFGAGRLTGTDVRHL